MVSTTGPSAAVADTPAASAPRVVSPFNPANAVTASRFLTLPPLWWAVAHGYHQWATLLLVICALFDKLDGLVAKLFNCRSAFGEVFDAIADAICYGFGLILVAAYGWAPAIPVVFVISLGVLNTVLRFVYAGRAGRTVNYKSYAMERIVGYTSFLIGFATSGMEVTYFYWAFVPVMLVIVLHDAKRMLVDPIPAIPAVPTAPAAGARA
ncbi:MAG TPA: CDP-alcohol phosphatidyltransferase family protein [Kofleriaceae bacterium]|jgi:phosphatidylglycerophosphate synthase|nr:CDP-alcohol phosphatidyltransferase family protein [Kofleriaceae bacterium]